MDRKTIAVVALALLGLGCKKPPRSAAKPAEQPPPVQNAATQYAADLQHDVKQAQDVADKANAALHQKSQAMDEADGAAPNPNNP